MEFEDQVGPRITAAPLPLRDLGARYCPLTSPITSVEAGRGAVEAGRGAVEAGRGAPGGKADDRAAAKINGFRHGHADREFVHHRRESQAALMERVAKGDQDAFTRLYDELCGLVKGTVLRVVRDWAITEEVTQETLLEVWRLAGRYDRSKGSVRGWTTGIAERRAVDTVRSEQAGRSRDDRMSRLEIAQDDTLSGDLEDRIDRERVATAMQDLTDVQRQAVELAYYQGHTYRQVAVLLGLPEGTVKSRIRQGLIRLRDALTIAG